jgi:Spy/CpxP family protein refolding chaperone
MMPKRLKQTLIAGAAFAMIALGRSAIAGAAAVGEPEPLLPAGVDGDTTDEMKHAGESWVHGLNLTDHEQYVRHHQRLAVA